MAEPGEETIVRKNWTAWIFNFLYPPTIAVLCVYILSRYYGLAIAGDIGREFLGMVHGAISFLTIWLQRFL